MKAVTVTTSPTEICAAGPRNFIHIQNLSVQDVYFKYDGGATVLTTANGVKLAAGESLVLNNDGTRNIFVHQVQAIVGAGTSDVRAMGVE